MEIGMKETMKTSLPGQLDVNTLGKLNHLLICGDRHT
jgi:hypothetical protein